MIVTLHFQNSSITKSWWTLIMNDDSEKKQTLTVLSWNVNGFTQKKTSILNHLNLLQADVVFLQETHVGPSPNSPSGSIQIQSLEHDYDWAVYTVFRRNCRGVAILFRKGLGFEGLRVVGDEKGRYLIISCRIQEQEFVFVTVYNPTDEKIDFNKLRDSLIAASEPAYLVVGGDFNTVMDAEVDKTSNNRNRGHRDRFKGLVSFLETFSLVDAWRWLYPEEKSFTYFDGKGKSRLDYFFLPVRILKSVTACQIHKRPQYLQRQGCISDHAPISVQIQTGGLKWQFRSGLLNDQGLMEQLSNMIKNISGAKQVKKEDLWPALKVRVTCETLAFYKSGDDFKSPEHLAGIQTSQLPSEKQPMEQKCSSSSVNHVQILRSPQILRNSSNLEEYLDYLHETKMFDDIELMLNATLTEPISKKEILSAILSLHNSEHLTPDGLPVSFYKHSASKITDLLQVFFNQVLDLQSIKCIFNESVVSDTFQTTTLNFTNTDHTYSSNVQHYSPVFIFNIDYNILALILSERLNSVMGYLLNQGKIRPHLSVQDCINAFEIIRADQLPVLVFSVKVDPGAVKWQHLFHRLKTLNLPARFRSMVRSLMLADGRTSIPPSQGLKAGCPLTPVLIGICLLPLIHSINEETRLQGVRIRGEHIKSVLDKDRAIIFLSNTNEGLDVFEELLREFMKNSGFVIDGRFSEVFITRHSGVTLKKEILRPFKRIVRGFWYKGVLVDSEDSGLVEETNHQCKCGTVMK